MPRKKKPFLNKKEASTFHVVRRSQRDVGGYFDEDGNPLDVPEDFLLVPTPDTQRRLQLEREEQQQRLQQVQPETHETKTHGNQIQNLNQIQNQNQNQNENENQNENQNQNQNETSFSNRTDLEKAKQDLDRAGLLNEYDYEKHMAPITGTGVYLTSEESVGFNSKKKSQRMSHLTHARNTTILLAEEDDDIASNTINNNNNNTIREVDRQLEGIELTADCMQDDIAEALFGEYQDGDFEELLDDFCVTANMEPHLADESEDFHQKYDTTNDNNNTTDSNLLDFDFDAHIAKLIQKAKESENGGKPFMPEQGHEWWNKSKQEFQNLRPLHRVNEEEFDEDDEDEKDEEDSWDAEFGHDNNNKNHHHHTDYDSVTPSLLDSMEAPGVVAKLDPDQEKALCDKFMETLAEYDSDEVGDLDNECEHIRGTKEFQDEQLSQTLTQYLQDQKDDTFMEGTAHLPQYKRTGGSGFSTLVGTRMVRHQGQPNKTTHPQQQQDDDHDGEQENEQNDDAEEPPPPTIQHILAEADQILANPEMDLPPEEVLIDGKSYFTLSKRNPWDCESILSTYSNLDNNPSVIGRSKHSRRKRRSKNNHQKDDDHLNSNHATQQQQQTTQIILSQKSGLPLEGTKQQQYQQQQYQDDISEYDTFASVNKGQARNKRETKEEKKARKQLVKQERMISRIEKKMMKEAFQEQFEKRSAPMNDDVQGQSVFRYS